MDKISKPKSKYGIAQRRMRAAAIAVLGSKCCQCGFSDVRALQIDHVNGGGTIERAKFRGTGYCFHKDVVESTMSGEGRYQLLCANCNWIKRYTHNECRRG